MGGWLQALARTRRVFAEGWMRTFGGRERWDDDALEAMEAALVRADVAPRLAMEWIALLARQPREQAHDLLRSLLLEALGTAEPYAWQRPAQGPLCILMVGTNGAGKTTTCAKLAYRARSEGCRPLLAAADTYRAAGSQQLKLWADRLHCDAVTGLQGADAAAVAFDAAQAARAREAHPLIVDTAGRMHTRQPLMEELAKLRRALGKAIPGAPHEIWLTLDAGLGQNALMQARLFHETSPLTGLVITKLDGSARGGFLFSVRRELAIPIRWAGLGEGADDLAPFDPEAFVEALLDGRESLPEV